MQSQSTYVRTYRYYCACHKFPKLCAAASAFPPSRFSLSRCLPHIASRALQARCRVVQAVPFDGHALRSRGCPSARLPVQRQRLLPQLLPASMRGRSNGAESLFSPMVPRRAFRFLPPSCRRGDRPDRPLSCARSCTLSTRRGGDLPSSRLELAAPQLQLLSPRLQWLDSHSTLARCVRAAAAVVAAAPVFDRRAVVAATDRGDVLRSALMQQRKLHLSGCCTG